MEKKNNLVKANVHTHIVIVVVAVLALILSIFNFATNLQKKEINEGEDITYNVYIGLTDKDAGYQTLDDNVAKEIIKTSCIGENVSYTIFPAEGGYKDKEGLIHTEKTMVLEMSHATEKQVYEIMNTICKRLNVNGVMYSKYKKDITYYYPNK